MEVDSPLARAAIECDLINDGEQWRHLQEMEVEAVYGPVDPFDWRDKRELTRKGTCILAATQRLRPQDSSGLASPPPRAHRAMKRGFLLEDKESGRAARTGTRPEASGPERTAAVTNQDKEEPEHQATDIDDSSIAGSEENWIPLADDDGDSYDTDSSGNPWQSTPEPRRTTFVIGSGFATPYEPPSSSAARWVESRSNVADGPTREDVSATARAPSPEARPPPPSPELLTTGAPREVSQALYHAWCAEQGVAPGQQVPAYFHELLGGEHSVAMLSQAADSS